LYWKLAIPEAFVAALAGVSVTPVDGVITNFTV